ncbi:MAG: twin-arginine translocation pathway signal, partial [Thermomicrobiales bacterium]|nr:twin-arginine translocation pathway signal [Thermomicrobiales bacterium]
MAAGRNEEFYEGDRDEVLSTGGVGETMQEVLARRWSRRGLVKGGLAAGLVLTAAGREMRIAGAQAATPVSGEATQVGGLTFTPITLDAGDDIVVAAGHTAVPFLRWGDPIMAGAPDWDLNNQSAQAQEQQFGYNCDWIEFFPLPPGSDSSDHGLLVVNHEYTNPELMFPGYLIKNPEFGAV